MAHLLAWSLPNSVRYLLAAYDGMHRCAVSLVTTAGEVRFIGSAGRTFDHLLSGIRVPAAR